MKDIEERIAVLENTVAKLVELSITHWGGHVRPMLSGTAEAAPAPAVPAQAEGSEAQPE